MAMLLSPRKVVSITLPAVPDELGVAAGLGSGEVSESFEPPLMLKTIILPGGTEGEYGT